jgi:hypothetical protein
MEFSMSKISESLAAPNLKDLATVALSKADCDLNDYSNCADISFE